MSGLVKGVKKVFKAIGNAVKKILKSPIFKIIAIVAATIFTAGAALGAFAAMGAGASLGGIASAAIAGGTSAFGAVGAAISSGLGMGGAAATTAAATDAGIAAGIDASASAIGGVAEGTAGIVADPMAAAAADAAAPGAASWSAADPGAMGLSGDEALAGANPSGVVGDGGLGGGASPATNIQQAMNPANVSPPSGVTPPAAPNLSTVNPSLLSDSARASIKAGMDASGWYPQGATSGLTGVPNASTSLWDKVGSFLTSDKGMLLAGQTVMGAGNGLLQAKAARDAEAYRERMSAVPDMTGTFQQKPGYRWALANYINPNGGK